ncbi:hypothetical protein [Komagataeibacter sp. FNDCR2]|uniref:hypothetical protein n=1 Tax=Komagataeibacter sp. FNDCR2 TaxID=2878682 RepID=UPI001E2BA731|nr:hypothetical protein [Komagataeibacter sp. FNDCR2]MCE2576860.1 hypothetical protein [Komagataeibacter sp. FNDCR2]
MMKITTKTRGQLNYEADVKAWPYYNIGRMIPRVEWSDLSPAVQANWDSEEPGWHAANPEKCKAKGLSILAYNLECGNLTLEEGREVAAAFGVLSVDTDTAEGLASALRWLAA